MTYLRSLLLLSLCMFSLPVSADDAVSEEESLQYYFGLMQQAQTFRVEPNAAHEYLRGVWRLDRRAHVGDGHYVQAERGDDVSLICNDERLIQIDFNWHYDEFIEVTEQLSSLTVEADGSFGFDTGRRYIPLDENHMAVAAYDYIAVLERVSGRSTVQE